jgi:site-specific DNA recombinase
LIGAIELKPKWLEEVLAILSLKDETERIIKERQTVQEKLRRMAQTYIDGLFPENDYQYQRKLLEMHLESLVIPEVDAAKEAGELIYHLPALWQAANFSERRRLIISMLDAVYVDAKQIKSIVAIRPKPPFIPIFQVAVSKKDSPIHIINEPLKSKSLSSSVLLVETGEIPSWPRTQYIVMDFLTFRKPAMVNK